MKKPIAFLVALLTAISITGCSNEIVHTPRASSSEPETSSVSSAITSSAAQNAATADEPDESSEPIVEETYWTSEPLALFGLEKVPEPTDMEFYETISSSTTMYITWKVNDIDKATENLANSIFKALADKGIPMYVYENGGKGAECKSGTDGASFITESNSLIEQMFRYNNIDYKLSIIGMYGESKRSEMKFVTLSIFDYSGLELTSSEEETVEAG